MMTSGKSPLVLPSIFWITGIIAGKLIALPLTFLCIIIFCELCFSFFLKKNLTILIFLILVTLGILRVSLASTLPQNHVSRILEIRDEITQPIEGMISSEVMEKEGKCYFDLSLISIRGFNIAGKIRFSVKQKGLKYGDKISTIATLNTIKPTSNPLAPNFQEYLNFKGIFARGYSRVSVKVTGSKIEIIKYLSIEVRKFIRERIEKRIPDNSGFIKAILIGEKSDLNEARELLTRAGLSHILAVSGLHVALITIIFFTIIKIFVRHKVILRIIIMIMLIMYGNICSWSPSVTRAILMISLHFIAQIIQRHSDSNNILFASLLLITIISPFQLFSVGLHMSFTAVFVLLNIIPLFSKYLHIIPFKRNAVGKIMINTLTLIFVSFLLSLFLSPITLFNFNQFNLNGIMGNILGIPLISIILPLSIIVIMIPPIPFLVQIYQASLSAVLFLFNQWSSLAAKFPLYWNFIPFSPLQILFFYLLLVVLLWSVLSYRKVKILYIAFLIFINGLLWIKQPDHILQVVFFNCGLGDLSLIETPDDEIIVIDCGPTNKDPDSFVRSALPFLQKSGIKAIDWLIITHAHNDHYGGIYDMYSNLEVKNLMVTDDFQTSDIWPEILNKIDIEKTNVITLNDTTHLPLGKVKIKIIHPDKDYYDHNRNNMSIIAVLEYNELSVLFNGDLEIEGERHIISKYSEFLDCDISKVGHHGSKTASSEEYIDLISPDYAIISTSVKNRFNFPHKATLEKYSFLGDKLIITGRDGAFTVKSDGINIEYRSVLGKKFNN